MFLEETLLLLVLLLLLFVGQGVEVWEDERGRGWELQLAVRFAAGLGEFGAVARGAAADGFCDGLVEVDVFGGGGGVGFVGHDQGVEAAGFEEFVVHCVDVFVCSGRRISSQRAVNLQGRVDEETLTGSGCSLGARPRRLCGWRERRGG